MAVNVSMSASKIWGAAFVVLVMLATPVRAQDVPAHNPDGMISISGTVERASADELVVKPRSGGDALTVKLGQPVHLYSRVPGNLSHLKDTNFVGVTSVKQPDGTERATAISILPDELRGVGEGSYMMNPSPGSAPSRMTNGNVSASRMTNGTASQSRMSNGSVTVTDASTLTVQYQGGVQRITVPPDTAVNEYQLTTTKPSVGDRVFLWGEKAPDGSLTASKGILTGK
jgi:hypothetical protein